MGGLILLINIFFFVVDVVDVVDVVAVCVCFSWGPRL